MYANMFECDSHVCICIYVYTSYDDYTQTEVNRWKDDKNTSYEELRAIDKQLDDLYRFVCICIDTVYTSFFNFMNICIFAEELRKFVLPSSWTLLIQVL